MDKETAKKLCSVIVDRLARNKVWGFPSLQYPGGRKRDRLKLEAERLAFVDCQTIDIQELQKILQSYDEKKGLLSVEYFRERVLLYPDEGGEKKARAYEPGKVGSLYPGVQLGQDQASRDFRYYLTRSPDQTSPPEQIFRSIAPYFKEADKAQEVAQKLRETVNEVIQDKIFFIEKGKDATERAGTVPAKSITEFFDKDDKRAQEIAQEIAQGVTQEVAHQLRETVNEVIQDNIYFIEPTGMVEPTSPESRPEEPEVTPSVPRTWRKKERLRVGEAAKILVVTPTRISQMVREGKLDRPARGFVTTESVVRQIEVDGE